MQYVSSPPSTVAHLYFFKSSNLTQTNYMFAYLESDLFHMVHFKTTDNEQHTDYTIL